MKFITDSWIGSLLDYIKGGSEFFNYQKEKILKHTDVAT